MENILDAVKHSNSYTAFVLKKELLLVEAAACAEACGRTSEKEAGFFFWGNFSPSLKRSYQHSYLLVLTSS